MKYKLSFILINIDIFIPIILINLLGSIYTNYTKDFLITTSIIFAISIIIYSVITNMYYKYFFSHMDEKLKHAFYSWLFTVIVEFLFIKIFYNDFTSINLNLIWIWILVPNVILLLRFFIKSKYFMNKENRIEILILGNDYKFTTYELKRLIAYNYTMRYVKDVYEIINESDVEFLVINQENFSIQDELEIKNKHSLINIFTIPNFLERYLRKLYISEKTISSLSQVKPFKFNQYIVKRFIDLIACVLVIPFLLILLPVALIAIKVQSTGEILFKQTRVTISNNKFKMYKFRTMHEISSQGDRVSDKDRIFPFGKFLRKFRFDEIPQILNVLYGDMHISGPRAEWYKLSEEYLIQIPFYKLRYEVNSGITGWAQVMFRYGHDSIDAKQKLMYDLYYIKNWSFWLDLEIGIRTFLVILKKQGI